MPNGISSRLSAIDIKGLFTSFIRFFAATKDKGMANNVPKVVAKSARKTVSTILSQVSMADLEILGAPTLVRVMVRIVCAAVSGRGGMRISVKNSPLASASKSPTPRLTLEVGINAIGPDEFG